MSSSSALTHIIKTIQQVKFPEEYCYSGFGEEARAIRGRYGSDVSLLAEALCPPEEDPRPTDEALGRHDEAVLDAAWIGHARHTLEDWMAALTTAGGGPVANLTGDRTANLREFLAVPLVTGEHFEQHLSALTFHLLAGRYGPEMAGTILANRQRAIENDAQAGQWVHASSSPGGGAGDGRLSPLGECCLPPQAHRHDARRRRRRRRGGEAGGRPTGRSPRGAGRRGAPRGLESVRLGRRRAPRGVQVRPPLDAGPARGVPRRGGGELRQGRAGKGSWRVWRRGSGGGPRVGKRTQVGELGMERSLAGCFCHLGI